MVNPQFFELDGIRYLSGDVVTGNQSASLHFCRVLARNTVDTCWQVNRTAASRTFFSPGFRNLLIAGPEVYADSFRVFEFIDQIRACSGFENPGERVIDIAFHPAGKRVAVALRQGEVWIYSLEPGCRIVLQRKIFNANLAQWAAGARNNTGQLIAVHFPTARVLLLTHGAGEIIAMDPETGLPKWSQSGRHAANRLVSAATASNDGATLAVWGSRHIELMHADTGTMLSGVMEFSEPGKMGRGLARVKWLSGDALEAEWETSSASDGTGQRIFYRRLGPDEAATAFVHGVSTESLTGYSNAAEHTPLAELR